jgi:hypothetical protein
MQEFTIAEVADLLNSCESKEEVRFLLNSYRIRGTPYSAIDCPLAKLAKGLTGLKVVVNRREMSGHALSPQVTAFINDFDQGLHPYLERGGK